MTLNVKSDYFSTDHRGKEMFYGSEFKGNFMEKYQVGYSMLDFIAADPGG